MTAAYLAKNSTDFGLERLDGGSLKAQDLMAAVTASPFLANSRLVIIEGVVANRAIGEALEKMMAQVPDTTVAVFVEGQVDQRTKAYRALQKADRVVKFDIVTGPKLMAWVKQEVTRLEGSIDPDAIAELIDRAGEDQWRLSGEINKLVNYDVRVTVDMVHELVQANMDMTIFGLVEDMTAGRYKEALIGYQVLLRQREPEMKILVMVQWQLRNLLLAKLAPNLTPNELAKAAGMSPYVAGKMFAAQGRIKAELLKSAYLEAAQCEYDIKSGNRKPDVAVEQLIYRVARSFNQ
jgi:DNA polymerase III delta subunit